MHWHIGEISRPCRANEPRKHRQCGSRTEYRSQFSVVGIGENSASSAQMPPQNLDPMLARALGDTEGRRALEPIGHYPP